VEAISSATVAARRERHALAGRVPRSASRSPPAIRTLAAAREQALETAQLVPHRRAAAASSTGDRRSRHARAAVEVDGRDLAALGELVDEFVEAGGRRERDARQARRLELVEPADDADACSVWQAARARRPRDARLGRAPAGDHERRPHACARTMRRASTAAHSKVRRGRRAAKPSSPGSLGHAPTDLEVEACPGSGARSARRRSRTSEPMRRISAGMRAAAET
jgi:hypothetical protein